MSILDTLGALVTTLQEELPLLRPVVPVDDSYGAAWPSTIVVGKPFYRSDLGLMAANDGTDWLSVHTYDISMQSRVAQPWSSGSSSMGLDVSAESVYSRKYLGVVLTHLLIGPNDASNHHTFVVARHTAGTPLATCSTLGFAASIWVSQYVPFSYISADNIYVFGTRVGNPGNMYISALVRYKLIIP